jgi:hypothetical protein
MGFEETVVLNHEESPKDQFHMVPAVTSEESVKVTSRGAVPEVGEPENAAVGNPEPPGLTVMYPDWVAVLLPEALVTESETS